MKRVLYLLTALLIAATAILSFSCSAQTKDRFTTNTTTGYDDLPQNGIVSGNELIMGQNGQGLLDVQTATEYDADEIKEDGINTRVATIWIVCISAVVFLSIMACVIYLARKNR